MNKKVLVISSIGVLSLFATTVVSLYFVLGRDSANETETHQNLSSDASDSSDESFINGNDDDIVVKVVEPEDTVSDGTDDESSSVIPSRDSEVEAPKVPEVQEYNYAINVEVVSFEPDSSYVGFRNCDNSSCRVYGGSASEIAKLTLGQQVVLKFNETQGDVAAAGTTYTYVVGEYDIQL